jgi:hypothetical protein
MNDTKIYKICNVTSNNEFLLDYAHYLVPQFRKHYFKYDAFKKIYKNIKQEKGKFIYKFSYFLILFYSHVFKLCRRHQRKYDANIRRRIMY